MKLRDSPATISVAPINSYPSSARFRPTGPSRSCIGENPRRYPRKSAFHRCRFPSPRARGRVCPYAEHAVTKRAQRQAVVRLLKLYRDFSGGAAAIEKTGGVHTIGKRSLARRPTDAPLNLDVVDDRPVSIDFSKAADAVALERLVAWDLLNAAAELDGRRYKVIASDQIDGRIAAVLQRKMDDAKSYRISLDDSDGRLLALELDDSTTGRPFRVEYSEHRRSGPLKMPHARKVYLGDELFAEDSMDKVVHSSK